MSPEGTQKSSQRTNEQWLAELRLPAPEGDAAQAALRALVTGAVTKAARDVDPSTLEDLVQVASLKVLDNLDRFEGRSKFSTWAYSVAVRAAFGELRRPSYRGGTEALSEETTGSIASDAPAPSTWAERSEIVEVLHRVIAEELSDRQRTAILGELAGTPQAELLETLSVNRNAFYKLLHDARRKLQAGLGAAGICDDQVREAFEL